MNTENKASKAKISSKSWLLILAYLIIVAVAVALTFFTEQDIASLIVSVVFFILVAIIFAHSIKKFSILGAIKNDLREATQKIKTDFEHNDSNVLWNNYLSQDNFSFNNSDLQNNYENFIAEIKRMENRSHGNYKCMIDDYLNNEFLDHLVRKNILDLVSGTMTGLGILGTFVGLAYGLQNFTLPGTEPASTDASTSIHSLMNGIKVAFYTSIYGTFFSLVFNYVYRQELEDAYEAMDEFLETYEKCVTGQADNDNFSYLQNSINTLPKALSYELGTCIKDALLPEFERLNTSFNLFAEKVSENQMNSLSEIVNNFINEMNKALGHNFTELSHAIDTTCTLQKESALYMHDTISKIGEMSVNVSSVNEIAQKTITTFADYLNQVNDLQKLVSSSSEQHLQYLEQQAIETQNMMQYLGQIAEYEQQITKATSHFSGAVDKQLEALQTMQDELTNHATDCIKTFTEEIQSQHNELTQNLHEQMDVIKETSTALHTANEEHLKKMDALQNEMAESVSAKVTQMTEAATEQIAQLSSSVSENLNELSSNVNAQITQTNATLESELLKFTETMSSQITTGLNNQIEELTSFMNEHIQQLKENSSSCLAEMQSQLNSLSEMEASTTASFRKEFESIATVTEKYAHDMSERFQALQESEQTVATAAREHLDRLAAAAELYTRNIAEHTQQQLTDITTLSQNTTAGLEKASREISAATKRLDDKFINSLNRTFDSFDENLSQITTHLSGTISEVERTTDRVPSVVNSAYEGIAHSFTDLQNELSSFLKAIETINQQIQEY